ncbi:Oligo-beta-mannoside-specific phosphotransferase enzyme IIA component [Listeria grayi]|uniref:PTS system cellobiose-specific transporter subunit IIA n=2 Tax=Listeria grayi TaxID=1641 RepID=A0A829R7W4_LISGR|nr:PTS lactose/cellobiose transporter subunit IIA [Listeria grayi]EUJ28661.1 PTS system cellobiose-specific transporter subunit IIA [Listeria grayi FSL F6-1183]MBC1921880.1 PTS lactose/cellobiose transporter subunit IIA [Listeria grayi]STY44660.1 Oligo-beta-mannoside-specific phosphotransferase enzyme IIA component [Listeria grayi]VEI36846.1 Oligo-beta-mannoside-specific phosphotransferase enzyme IIA component [Listeria grayi]
MNELEMIIFNMISEVGSARSSYLEGLRAAREGDFEEAEAKLKEGNENLNNGHHVHHGLIQKEASGETIEFKLLLIHAEDLLITTETLKELVAEFVHVYRKIEK